jgi:hypothetical protein
VWTDVTRKMKDDDEFSSLSISTRFHHTKFAMQADNQNNNMTGFKKICKIDGEKLLSTEDLIKAIQQEVATDGHKNSSDLTEILNTSGGIDIVWQNAELSSERLGENFEKIVETIRDHGPGGSRPTDNVNLFLN